MSGARASTLTSSLEPDLSKLRQIIEKGANVVHNLDCVRVFDILSPLDIVPSRMRLGSWGFALYNDMDVYRIANDDPQQFKQVVRLLK